MELIISMRMYLSIPYVSAIANYSQYRGDALDQTDYREVPRDCQGKWCNCSFTSDHLQTQLDADPNR